MGRPRKTPQEHLRSGYYRPSRHGPLVPDDDGPPAPPEMPAHLAGTPAADVWGRLLPLMAGVVRERDADTFAGLCWWLAERSRIQEQLATMQPGGKGYTSLVVAAGVATDKLTHLSRAFGMTPADRARLGALAVPTGPAKPKVATRPRTALDAAGPPEGN